MGTSYDTIGVNYSDRRTPDPRIRVRIETALGSAETVLNIGAGTGSYEPSDRRVTAVEPSTEMIRQRGASAAPVVQAHAENLPFDGNSFDASMAILTVHHWTDKAKGLKEMRRVTRGPIVLFTYDPAFRGFWLLDYFPELAALDEAKMPTLENYKEWLGPVEISAVPIPHDCTDGFLCACWRRPQAYLDPGVRSAMSPFWAIGDISQGLKRLSSDLDAGAWEKRHSDLLDLDECDCGYRLVTTI